MRFKEAMMWLTTGSAISAVVVILNISVISAQEHRVGYDSTGLSGEKKVDFEAETRRILSFEISEWKIFESQEPKFEIKYPAGLSAVVDENNKLTLSHALPHKHGDPCDMSDDPGDLQELTDFRIEIEIVEGGLKQAIIRGENSAAPSFLVDDTVRSLEHYALTIRSLKGYELPHGVEGCGGYRYYFPLNKSSTLLVRRKLVTELDPIIRNYRDYRQLPGVIFPDEEERLFKTIISTFRLLE